MPTEFLADTAPSVEISQTDQSSLENENVKVPYEANVQAKTEPVIETSEMEIDRPELQLHEVNMTEERKQCLLYGSDQMLKLSVWTGTGCRDCVQFGY